MPPHTQEEAGVCKGCQKGCPTCFGLLMRKPYHVGSPTEPALLGDGKPCQRMPRPYTSRKGSTLCSIDLNLKELGVSASTCPDCKLLLDVVEHFSLVPFRDSSEEPYPDLTIYLEPNKPMTITCRFASAPVISLAQRAEDPSPLLFIGKELQLPSHPLDPLAISRLRLWLRTCLDTHPRCSRLQDRLPTRLLDLRGGSPDDIVLTGTKHLSRTTRYATLSHMWGTHQPLKTTRATLQSRMKSIPLQDLPLTYRDAVQMCQALGIRHLWIDSLCIIQDDDADWQKESSHMAFIYGSCHVTIAADAADDSGTGFLFQRKHQQFTYASDIGHDLAVVARQLPRHPTANARGTDLPALLLRSWVFQERLLSPRVIHVSKEEIQFECHTACDCECGEFELAGRPKSVKHMFTDRGEIELYDRSLPAPVDQWFRIVEIYTSMGITFDKDRFPALSGIANKLECDELGEYVAGMWHSFLPYSLLWTHAEAWAHPYRRPTTYVAPTWSWASVCGPITWFHVRGREHENDQHTPVDVLEVSVTMKGLDPRGEISDGHLRLKGSFGHTIILHTGETKFSWELDIRGGGELYLDIPDGSETASGNTVYLMSISTNNAGDVMKSLVLQEAQQVAKYQRIGLFSHWGWEKETSPEPDWTTAEIVVV